jgi:hypothetical protein
VLLEIEKALVAGNPGNIWFTNVADWPYFSSFYMLVYVGTDQSMDATRF